VVVVLMMVVLLLLLLLLLLSAMVLTLTEAPCTHPGSSEPAAPADPWDVCMLRIEQGVLMVLHLQVLGRQSK